MRIARTLSPGHPDRACDIIAETIVDEYLRRDPDSRLRIRVAGGKGALFVTGVVSSKADFDVGAIAVRTAGALGVRQAIEPFVALEPISGSMLPAALRLNQPIVVAAYAAVETPEAVPMPVALSRRLAKRLEDLRRADPDWFWLEPGFEISVAERAPGETRVFVACGHGTKPIDEARDMIRQIVASSSNTSDIRINVQGPTEGWGLDADVGTSGVIEHPYGTGLPITTALSGLDPFHPQKYGTWLARDVARRALQRSGSKAVLVQGVYEPDEDAPSFLRIRDERGRDVSEADDLERMSISAIQAMMHPSLNADAIRWGFVGEIGLPWEA